MKILVVVPAYNEGPKLEWVVKRVTDYISRKRAQPAIDFLIVDDASTDGVPNRLSQQFHTLYLRNETRSGVGAALRKAYDFGLEKGYDIFVTMAGNNKDDPEEIDRLIHPIVTGETDFVQGSRYLPGGSFGNMPQYRLFATQILHPLLFSFISGQKITDSTNGFRAFRASILRDQRIDLKQDWLRHYELEPYLFCRAIQLKYRVGEAPVSKIYPDKKLGYSKMIPFVSWWSILRPLVYLFLKIKK